MGFVSLYNFHRRKLRPGEALSVFVHDLRKLIDQAIPNMAKEPLLLHQFLTGFPGPIKRQSTASGDVKTIEAALTHARLLMTIDAELVAMVDEKPSEVQRLAEQVGLLTEQVAALSMHQRNRQSRSGRQPRCFGCNKVGHVQRNYPYRYQDLTCFAYGQPGHIARYCQLQGNEWGDIWTGQQASPSTSPSHSDIPTMTVAVVKCRATMISGKLGGFAVEFMLDSGSSVSLI